MENQELHFETMPRNYLLCFNDECQWADHFLISSTDTKKESIFKNVFIFMAMTDVSSSMPLERIPMTCG
ncbi:MAG: hypothetical protein IJK42_04965 [Prevotella sp.]|nr:hypothetical protein [Prevotella sp.]MBQ6209104.1 hypothetical protein [Prevotella sp.]